MKQIILFGLAILLMSSIGFGQTDRNIKHFSIPDNWKTLNEEEFTIQYPDTFELDRTRKMGVRFFLSTKRTSQQDIFSENVNLLIQDLQGLNMNLDKYVQISEAQIKTMLEKGKIIKSEKKLKNNKKYHRVMYSGKQGEFDLKWLQYYWVEQNKAYVLTLTCEQNQFDKYLLVGEGIMSTFRIK